MHHQPVLRLAVRVDVPVVLQLCSAVHEHSLEILEGQMMQQEALMSQLALELDNGRLLRLLARLVMVSEGSQTSLEPNWSETGQHIKIFQVLLLRCFLEHGCNCFGLSTTNFMVQSNLQHHAGKYWPLAHT